MVAYLASIYPNGIDHASVELVFYDQNDKNDYLRREAIYCSREQSEYLGELFNTQTRKEKKQRFHQKRVEFAKKHQFKAVSRSRWERKIDRPDSGPLGVA